MDLDDWNVDWELNLSLGSSQFVQNGWLERGGKSLSFLSPVLPIIFYLIISSLTVAFSPFRYHDSRGIYRFQKLRWPKMNLSSEIHSLECRSLSYMSTLAGTGSWLVVRYYLIFDSEPILPAFWAFFFFSRFSRIYRPPLVAQFLKDVSLTAHSGEVHGVIGVAGKYLNFVVKSLLKHKKYVFRLCFESGLM